VKMLSNRAVQTGGAVAIAGELARGEKASPVLMLAAGMLGRSALRGIAEAGKIHAKREAMRGVAAQFVNAARNASDTKIQHLAQGLATALGQIAGESLIDEGKQKQDAVDMAQWRGNRF